MSKIFNSQIVLPDCTECAGDSWQRDEKNQIIQFNGIDQRCSCYYAHRYLNANIGYNYWTIEPDNFQGEPEDLLQITKSFAKSAISV